MRFVGTPQYNDYTSVNPTLDGLIDEAKQQLNVRLPGDPLPAVSHLEDLIATWDLCDLPRNGMGYGGELMGRIRRRNQSSYGPERRNRRHIERSVAGARSVDRCASIDAQQAVLS